MSRKGVIAKRVKAAPDGHIENQRQPHSPAGRGTMFRARPKPSRGRPRHNATPRHATNASRRATVTPSVRPGKLCLASGRDFHRPNSYPPTTPADHNIRPDRSDSAKTRLSGRSSRRPSERRGRPEAVFEAQSAQFKPKAGADLARLAPLERTRDVSPQAPPPSWDSPPRPSTLKTKKKLLPYLEAADLETSSQAASHQEEHLLATPEEEINPELIEFVKRDQFHDLFSEYALEHIDHFDNLCDSYGVFDFEKKMMLFSTSLAGPALDWAQHEPPLQSSHGSILEKLSWKGLQEATFQIQVPPLLSSAGRRA
ncbi:unnamed protein product [Microthlaspi erraticum]|uniref:Uncharacterized protein n=1 Tax=Microthlaspi erraticum TaxID=1685480 RepID=A0A6D2JZB7_9BRAS|nr:unnamed protein product [Microthlaspi erraticum]